MPQRKDRLTVTVDRALVEVANAAVAAGRADSLSGWVNQALAERAAREQRLQALADAVAAYEAKYGQITAQELAAQAREDRVNAIVVRGKRKALPRKRKGRSAA